MKLEFDPSFEFRFRDETPTMQGMLAGQYPHIVDDKLYYQTAEPKQIRYAQYDKEGTYVRPSDDIVLEKSAAGHNFRVFVDNNIDTATRYKAIGGLSVHKSYPDMIGCEFSGGLEEVELPNPCRPHKPRLCFAGNDNHPRHGNGLYVLESEDGISWSSYSNGPIFSYHTVTKTLPNTIAFDWMPSVVYNGEEYRIFIRCNPKLGVRTCFTSTSKDLLNWSMPELINVPGFEFEHDNYYYFDCYFIKGKYVAFAPHFRHYPKDNGPNGIRFSDCYTDVLVSNNGVDWEIRDTILKSKTSGHLTFPHITTVRKEGSRYALYAHEGFLSNSNVLRRYYVEESELLSCIS